MGGGILVEDLSGFLQGSPEMPVHFLARLVVLKLVLERCLESGIVLQHAV